MVKWHSIYLAFFNNPHVSVAFSNYSASPDASCQFILVLGFTYCKYGNFRENFIFAKSVKRHICDYQNSQLGHDLPISVNDRAISTFREDFICEVSRKLNPRENVRIYSIEYHFH